MKTITISNQGKTGSWFMQRLGKGTAVLIKLRCFCQLPVDWLKYGAGYCYETKSGKRIFYK